MNGLNPVVQEVDARDTTVSPLRLESVRWTLAKGSHWKLFLGSERLEVLGSGLFARIRLEFRMKSEPLLRSSAH